MSSSEDKSRRVLQDLESYESRNVLQIDSDYRWPVVWERARGMRVWDVDGRSYLDATAAFGVAAAGHANPRVVRAGRRQMGQLLHAMGDVHPHPGKALLAKRLSRLTFGQGPLPQEHGKTVFCNSGFEAVETALKTARLATGKPGVIAFEGGYHGLGYGALNATHRDHFKAPFWDQLSRFAHFAPFPTTPTDAQAALQSVELIASKGECGAVLIEPIQARGGIRIPADGFLSELRRVATARGLVLIFDEIYTGFGRTGRMFAAQHWEVIPDVYCLGKALTGGFPLSACVGRADLMDHAWPVSDGEALHTSTYLGHPVGCAMAMAQIQEIEDKGLDRRAATMGSVALGILEALRLRLPIIREVRGRGLMIGLELASTGRPGVPLGVQVMKHMISEGWIVLPEGAEGNVLAFTPPLIVTGPQIRSFCAALGRVLDRLTAV